MPPGFGNIGLANSNNTDLFLLYITTAASLTAVQIEIGRFATVRVQNIACRMTLCDDARDNALAGGTRIPKLPQITTREELPQDKGHIFDAMLESRGRIGLPYALLLHSPELAGLAEPLGKHVRYESTLMPGIRELATITTSRELECDYMWFTHTEQARAAGASDDTIEAVGNRGSLDSLDADDALTIRFGRELLHDKRVSEVTWSAARTRFGVQGITDLTGHYAWYSFVAHILNGFEIEPPQGEPGLPEIT